MYNSTVDEDPVTPGAQHTFCIHSRGKKYLLQADSLETKRSWIKALEDVIQYSPEKKFELKYTIAQRNKKISHICAELGFVDYTVKEMTATLTKFKSSIGMISKGFSPVKRRQSTDVRKSVQRSDMLKDNSNMDPEERFDKIKFEIELIGAELEDQLKVYEKQVAMFERRILAVDIIRKMRRQLPLIDAGREITKSAIENLKNETHLQLNFANDAVQKILGELMNEMLERQLGHLEQRVQPMRVYSPVNTEQELRAKIARLEQENRILAEEMKRVKAQREAKRKDLETVRLHINILTKEKQKYK